MHCSTRRLLPLFLLICIAIHSSHQSKVILCYYSSWATYRWSNGKFDVEDIDPFLCTHLAYGFVGLDHQKYTIKVLDPYNDLQENYGRGAFDRFTGLKKINPELKTLLSIGGWNEGATSYSAMVSIRKRRKVFIQSAVEMLLKHNFDGLDFDWEYPGGRDDSPGSDDDKENYIKFLDEIREEFDKHGLLLTAAVSAGKHTIDRAYDVPSVSKNLDYINVMTYDYHGWFKYHHFTGINSPLYAMDEELNPQSPGYQLNTNFSMKYWEFLGARKEQLLVGMGSYGRGFILSDPKCNGVYCKANNGIDPGIYGSERGIWGFNEYCEIMAKPDSNAWTFVRDPNAVAPYIYKGNQWFSFDDIYSISVKAQYVLDHGYGGAFLWSIDTDDFNGICGRGKFAILNTIKKTFHGEIPSTQSPWITPENATTLTTIREDTTSDPLPTTATMGTPSISTTPGTSALCTGGTEGIQPHPSDCHKFIMCIRNEDNTMRHVVYTCQSGLSFNPEILTCDWSHNVVGCNRRRY